MSESPIWPALQRSAAVIRAALRQEERKRLRARAKALEKLGPCHVCGEPADFMQGWCDPCAEQSNRLHYKVVPLRYREDVAEARKPS
jgi:hypothetical protein